ncbi:C40 family peptidase [Streptomyces montanisoli]|uniref:C40 family peptidase n=1 Tax=Streptomyces montanisoli TaxID=2798581 RepID=A0A940RV52_9ACTN|nr:C40 family peptidase [Streptomyces montanisoli]MBP0458677.1 C40 family peptidase [Streptomyces montanisoli]
MPHTAPIRTHRKPRRNAPRTVLRAGVAGGVLSTIAVAGAAGTAHAEPVTETIEMPTLSANLSAAVAQSAAATQQVALDMQMRAQLQSQEDTAAKDAAKAAKKAKSKAEAEAKAKAEAKKKAEEAARAKAAAAAHASRSSARTELASYSSPSDSSSSSSSSSSTATGSAAAIVSFVESHIGDAYVMGSTGPNAFDCSGLVQAAYRTVGVDLPRVSQSQSTAGTQVSLSNVQPGDILYWGSAGNAYHVAIYVGNGKFVGAQNPSSGVVEHDLSYDQPTGAVRVL